MDIEIIRKVNNLGLDPIRRNTVISILEKIIETKSVNKSSKKGTQNVKSANEPSLVSIRKVTIPRLADTATLEDVIAAYNSLVSQLVVSGLAASE